MRLPDPGGVAARAGFPSTPVLLHLMAAMVNATQITMNP
jgi:hypothetical protein